MLEEVAVWRESFGGGGGGGGCEGSFLPVGLLSEEAALGGKRRTLSVCDAGV